MRYVSGSLNRTAALPMGLSIGNGPIYLGKISCAHCLESQILRTEQHHILRGVFYIPASGVSVLQLSVLRFAQIVLHLSDGLL